MVARPWSHWATSADLRSLRLPAHDAGTGLSGRALGTSLQGFDFVFDPFDAYQASLISNPNMIVAGSIGAGKSTLVKMLLDRALQRGRRVVVIDPKGEYGALGASYGANSVALGRDGWCDPFPVDAREGLDFLRALLGTAQGAPLSSDQHYVLDELFRSTMSPRPSRVLRSLLEVLRPHLVDLTHPVERSLALMLYRFVEGDLAGLFDGEGNAMVLEGQFVVVDLSTMWSSSALSIAALSAVGAAQQMVGAEQGGFGYLVLDEAWALLADPHALRWLQGFWKLARSRGISHVLVLHRWTDVGAAGDQGSAQRERAEGLLRECETSWLFRQPPNEAREMAVALGLHEREERYLVSLPKGVALVRYGAHRSIVRINPDGRDVSFVDTDQAMRGAGS